MALHPFVLSLAEDLGRLSLATSPFYHVRHPTYLALASGGDQPHHDKKSSRPISIIGKDGFQLCMDVQHFKPSELNVKVVDNSIIIEGQHEEREDDHGYIARHFVRRYSLPKDYDPNKVVSTLSSDGVLTVSVPKPQSEDKSSITIPIQQVGPAHLNVKENPEDEIAKVVVEDVKDEEDVKD